MTFKYQEFLRVPKEYVDDAIRIQYALSHHGYFCNAWFAYQTWREYSESVCAGWINLPKTDDAIVSILVGDSDDKIY